MPLFPSRVDWQVIFLRTHILGFRLCGLVLLAMLSCNLTMCDIYGGDGSQQWKKINEKRGSEIKGFAFFSSYICQRE